MAELINPATVTAMEKAAKRCSALKGKPGVRDWSTFRSDLQNILAPGWKISNATMAHIEMCAPNNVLALIAAYEQAVRERDEARNA